MIDPREHLECITRLAAEITAALDRGDIPYVADCRLIASNAQVLQLEFIRRELEAAKGQRERTSAEDKASQFATKGGERL